MKTSTKGHSIKSNLNATKGNAPSATADYVKATHHRGHVATFITPSCYAKEFVSSSTLLQRLHKNPRINSSFTHIYIPQADYRESKVRLCVILPQFT